MSIFTIRSKKLWINSALIGSCLEELHMKILGCFLILIEGFIIHPIQPLIESMYFINMRNSLKMNSIKTPIFAFPHSLSQLLISSTDVTIPIDIDSFWAKNLTLIKHRTLKSSFKTASKWWKNIIKRHFMLLLPPKIKNKIEPLLMFIAIESSV